MQKNLYYRSVLRRKSILDEIFLFSFLKVASYPRLLLEVFIRKNFGERYFRLFSAILVTVVLAITPTLLNKIFPSVPRYAASNYYRGYNQSSVPDSPFSVSHFITWYIYLALFLYMSILRFLEIQRNPSVYDFGRYSLASGKINPAFFKITLPGRKTDWRVVETILEPSLFLIVGFFLCLFSQYVGYLLIICSIFYSLSYVAAYNAGDNFVMDKIDEIICNQELKKAFVDGVNDDQTRGFRFIGRKPGDAEMREQLLPLMTEDDQVFDAK